MRKPRIAILGATGVVGREITKITDELNVEFESIRFLSSAKSAGTKITFKGKEYTVEEATPEIFDDIDIVMASAGGSTSQKFAPEIKKRGGVIIDNSSAVPFDSIDYLFNVCNNCFSICNQRIGSILPKLIKSLYKSVSHIISANNIHIIIITVQPDMRNCIVQ